MKWTGLILNLRTLWPEDGNESSVIFLDVGYRETLSSAKGRITLLVETKNSIRGAVKMMEKWKRPTGSKLVFDLWRRADDSYTPKLNSKNFTFRVSR